MATITIDMAGVVTSFELADADAGRILTAYTAMMGPKSVEQPDGTYAPEPLTPTEVITRLANEIVSGLASNTVAWERDQAAAEAREQVPPLVVELG